MGLYGSPDLGNLYTEKKEPKKNKRKSNRLQTNIWVWIAIIIVNVLFLLSMEMRVDVILTALIFDTITMAIISVANLIYNLNKKNTVKDDIIFLLSSIVVFFILSFILGTIVS